MTILLIFTAVTKLENPLIAITTKGKRICKKKKKKSVCETSEFGCCFDEKTLAKGPFSAGNIYILNTFYVY